MKTILIPVDFSDNSLITCKYALRMVNPAVPTTLHLLHIYPDQLMIPDSSFPSGIDSDGFMNVQFIEELRNQSEESMKSLLKQLEQLIAEKKMDNLIVTHKISGGDPEWEIRNQCEELSPEIIIMGTHGTGKKGFLEGIMAEKIMDHANVPVIAVPANTRKCTIQKIMYASNGSEKDFAKIKLLQSLFKPHEVEIFVVHFSLKNDNATRESFMKDLKEALTMEEKSAGLHFITVEATDKQSDLEIFVKEKNIDTIAFISHKTNIFKSLFSNDITKKDFFKLGLPMLAMHE